MKKRALSLTLALAVCLGLCLFHTAAAGGTGTASVQLDTSHGEEDLTVLSPFYLLVKNVRSADGQELTPQGSGPDVPNVTAYGTLRSDPSVTATAPGWVNASGWDPKPWLSVSLPMGNFFTAGVWDVYVTFPACDRNGAVYTVTSNTFTVTLGHASPRFLRVREGQTPAIDAAAGTATWTGFTLEVTDAFGNFCADYQTNTSVPEDQLGYVGPVTVRPWNAEGCPATATEAPVVNGVAVIDKLTLTNRTGAPIVDPWVDFLVYYTSEVYYGGEGPGDGTPHLDMSWLRTQKTIQDGTPDSQGVYVFSGLTIPAAGSDAPAAPEVFMHIGNDPAPTGTAVANSGQALTLNGKPAAFNAYAVRNAVGDTNYIKLRDLAYLLSGTRVQFNVRPENDNIRLETAVAYQPVPGDTTLPFSGDQAYTKTTSKLLIGDQEVELTAFCITDANGGDHNYVKIVDMAQLLDFRVWYANGVVNLDTTVPFDPADFS